jgi:peptide/nickel transport system substrate-binding protein
VEGKEGKMRMRRTVTLVVTLLVLLSFVVACAPATPAPAPTKPAPVAAATSAPAPAAATAAPAAATKPAAAPTAAAAGPTVAPVAKIKRGGTIVQGRNFTYNDMDVQRTQSSGPITMMIYDKLIDIDPVPDPKSGAKYQLMPLLAEDWSVVDPTTVELKLRKGVKFQDGSDWNAELAKWNLDRMLTDKKSMSKEVLSGILSVSVKDPSTVQLKLKEPWGPLFLNLTSVGPGNGMVSKAAVDKGGDEILSTKPVGSGPMVLDQWARDDRVTLKRWDGYWQKGVDGQSLPYFDTFVERFISDPSVSLVEMKAGTVHLTENLEPKDVAGVKANADLVYQELTWVSTLFFTYGLNAEKAPFKDSKPVRYALQHALDREGMVKAMGFGMGKPAYYWAWADTTLGYNAQIPRYEFDVAKAKKLLADAGYPNGIDIELLAISRQPEQRIGEMAKQMWDNAGIRTTINAMERLTSIDRARSGNFQVYFYGHRNYPDPEASFRLVTCGASSNYTGYCNQELMKCFAEGRKVFDTNEREKVYSRCLGIIQDDALVGGGYFIPQNRTYNKAVKGVEIRWLDTDLRRAWVDK